MSIIKKIVALMLVCVMALGLVGCGDTTWIVKAGDIVINSGMNDVAFELIRTRIEQML